MLVTVYRRVALLYDSLSLNFRGAYTCSTKIISNGRVRKVAKCNNCLEDRAQLVKSDQEVKERVLKKVKMILEDFIDLGKNHILSNHKCALIIVLCFEGNQYFWHFDWIDPFTGMTFTASEKNLIFKDLCLSYP